MLQIRPLEELERKASHSLLLGQHTAAYFEGQISESESKLMIRSIAEAALLHPTQECLLFGCGSHRKRTYKELNKRSGVQVLWSGQFLPWFLYPIGLVAASYGGLLKVVRSDALVIAFETLSQLAMVELYCVRKPLVEEIRDHVIRQKWRSRPRQIVGHDETYFCYGVDGDARQASEVYAWCLYAHKCPESLRNAIAPFIQSKSS